MLGALRKPSCGDVAAYSAVCCISDFGIVVGDWTADSHEDQSEEVNSGYPTKDKVGRGFLTKGVGVKGMAQVWKSMTALTTEPRRKAA